VVVVSRQTSASRRLEHPDAPPGPRPQPTPARGAVELPFPVRLDEGFAATWRSDLTSGLVVFLVALPLCLGVALASGAPLFSGLVTGIVGGLVVSRLSGSQLMVSGPAAGLTAIVSAAIIQLGSFDAFLVAVVLGGLLQVGLGLARSGIIAYFFPSSVIRGMLAAIGLILILKQLPYALGTGIVVFESDSFAEPQGGNTITSILNAARNATPLAVLISVGSLALLAAWPRLAPPRIRKALPAPLVVVLLGVAVTLAASTSAWALPAAAFVQLPVVSSAGELLAQLSTPDWGVIGNPDVWRVALTVGLVASLETLLSLEATDKLDPYRRTSPANRELLAQGTGNMLAGLAGGLPMTGVIVRSAANIEAGAKTWRSSFAHGAMLLLAVAAIPALLNRIPLATLAAVLLFTGYKLAHPRLFAEAWRVGPAYALPFVVTVVAILLTDLLIGIAIGLAVGAFFILLESARSAYSYDVEESPDHHRVRISLAEQVTFLNKARIVAALRKLPQGCVVTVDGSRSRHIDHDVLEILHEFHATCGSRGITARLVAIPSPRVAAGAH
jgi:MFS superfamily sulfate permease-like transporter